ncbi:MAG TPA: hypothetical protein PKA19_14275 [Bacillota bacterium]|nr:hypothetical protein [Bacillota bacterium]
MPISIYAAGDNAREPTLTEGTPVEEGTDLTPADNPEPGTPAAIEPGTTTDPEEGTTAATEPGTTTDPVQETPAAIDTGTPADPDQGTAVDPEQGTPVDPEQGTTTDPTPVVEPPAAGEEVTTDPAITEEEAATEPAIVVEPTAATLTIVQRLLTEEGNEEDSQVIEGLEAGQTIDLAQYLVDVEWAQCITEEMNISLDSGENTAVLEYVIVDQEDEIQAADVDPEGIPQ